MVTMVTMVTTCPGAAWRTETIPLWERQLPAGPCPTSSQVEEVAANESRQRLVGHDQSFSSIIVAWRCRAPTD